MGIIMVSTPWNGWEDFFFFFFWYVRSGFIWRETHLDRVWAISEGESSWLGRLNAEIEVEFLAGCLFVTQYVWKAGKCPPESFTSWRPAPVLTLSTLCGRRHLACVMQYRDVGGCLELSCGHDVITWSYTREEGGSESENEMRWWRHRS